MILNALAAAFALLSMNFSAPAMSVESTSVIVSADLSARINTETINSLIKDHAAPYWGLTPAEAVAAYEDGDMTISEVVAGSLYHITYDGILEVVWEQGQG